MDDLAAQMKIFVGLIGAFVAAAIGSLARHVYAVDGFSWRRAAWDLPFAMVCAMTVGGLGEMFHVTPIAVYGGAGACGYLGPQWLEGWLKKRAERDAPQDGEGDGDGPQKDA